MKKHWSVLVASGALVVSFLGFPGMASATSGESVSIKGHPSGFHYEQHDMDGHQGVRAWCTKSNGGHYKALVICVRILNGEKIHREAGFWQSRGKDSIVWCPPETLSQDAGIMTKAS
ncbi:hypothetical protein [Streptomyces sp. NPDC047071]|uniref:hypothetical protein n=1 Tax=Streptomyces sp. NPDC047071 TaxID=3154808 RepID=UPI0034560FE1